MSTLPGQLHSIIFEQELTSWHLDESAWPQKRDFKTSTEWFEVNLNSMVFDLCDYYIEVDEFDTCCFFNSDYLCAGRILDTRSPLRTRRSDVAGVTLCGAVRQKSPTAFRNTGNDNRLAYP